MNIFLDFIKFKLRPKYKNLRHSSLHMNVLYRYVQLYAWETNIKRAILVKKIKVKKIYSQFLTPSFCYFFANLHITHKYR